jgi:hypothetical protein
LKTFEKQKIYINIHNYHIIGIQSELKVSGNGTEKVVRVLQAGIRKFAPDGEKDKCTVEKRNIIFLFVLFQSILIIY